MQWRLIVDQGYPLQCQAVQQKTYGSYSARCFNHWPGSYRSMKITSPLIRAFKAARLLSLIADWAQLNIRWYKIKMWIKNYSSTYFQKGGFESLQRYLDKWDFFPSQEKSVFPFSSLNDLIVSLYTVKNHRKSVIRGGWGEIMLILDLKPWEKKSFEYSSTAQ